MPQETPKRPAHWIVQLNHRVRSATFVIVFAVIGAHMVTRNYGALAWELLVAQFLLYPHLVYLLGRYARDPMRAEMRALVLDPVLMGIWVAALGFPLWITYSIAIGTLISIAVYRSLRGMVEAAVALLVGALLTIAVQGLHFSPQTDWPATMLSMTALTLYLLMVAKGAHARALKLHAARAQLRHNEQVLQTQLGEIQALQGQLSEQANRDPLTGLYNRRYLGSTTMRELARCRREGHPLSLMLIDIDHFKRINDAHGHQAGDEVLRNVALRLSERSRAADVVCRYGGEEFLLLLPDMPQAAALELANRYRMSLETSPIPFGELRIQATLSIGIATYPDHGQSPEDLIECADQAMYQAKTAGRNRVCVFTPEPGAACQPTAGALAEVTPTRSWPAACC